MFAACRTPLVSSTHGRGTVVAMAEDQAPDRLAAVRWSIAHLRQEKGMSQAELAEKVSEAGIKFYPQTIQKIESGARTIRLDEAFAIADALGVATSDLFTPSEVQLIDDDVIAYWRERDAAIRALQSALTKQETLAIRVDLWGIEADDEAAEAIQEDPLALLLYTATGWASRTHPNRLAGVGGKAKIDLHNVTFGDGQLPRWEALIRRRAQLLSDWAAVDRGVDQ